MRALTPLVLFALLMATAQARDTTAARRPTAYEFVASDSLRWPTGTEVIRFENIEGIVLLSAGLRGRAGVDTIGPLALDTGAGYLALDLELARLLGLEDSASTTEAVDIAEFPLPRLTLGAWTIDQVEPVLTVDAEVIRRVCDRPVLGLLGQKLLRDRAVWIDYREQVLALIPVAPPTDVEELPPTGAGDRSDGRVGSADSARAAARNATTFRRSRSLLAGVLTPHAVGVRFSLVGDGKMLIHGAVSDPRPALQSAAQSVGRHRSDQVRSLR